MTTVSRKFYKLFCTIGFPKIVQSDNGSEFINKVMKQLTDKLNLDHRNSTPYHPRGNGAAERFVQTAKTIILKMLEGNTSNWEAQFAMNQKIAALHNSSPFTLFFGRRTNLLQNYENAQSIAPTTEQLLKRIEDLHEIVFPAIADHQSRKTKAREIAYNLKHKLLHNIPPGTLVMTCPDFDQAKIDQRYEGPFKVLRRTRGGTYIIQDADGTPIRRHYAPSQLKILTGDDTNVDATYVVENILSHRINPDGTTSYYVKWKHYSDSENTWEPSTSFIDTKIISNYHKKHKG